MQFTVDESNNVTTNPAGVQVTTVPAQLWRNYLSSISSPIDDLDATLLGNTSEDTIAAPDAPENTFFNTLDQSVSGVGCRQDQLSNGDGGNYKNRTFSHRIQSTLNGISPNSIYTFMLHKNQISFNDMGGIAVSN